MSLSGAYPQFAGAVIIIFQLNLAAANRNIDLSAGEIDQPVTKADVDRDMWAKLRKFTEQGYDAQDARRRRC